MIFRNVDRKGWDPSIKTYLADGGYKELKKALKMKPGEVTEPRRIGFRLAEELNEA